MTEPTNPATDADPLVVVARFNDAFNAHDVEALLRLVSDDCVFEGTGAPDGSRHVGADAVCRAWGTVFAQSPDAHFAAEETFGCGERVVVRWRYEWGGSGADDAGHVRGVDVFRVVHGRVTEKLAYVKG